MKVEIAGYIIVCEWRDAEGDYGVDIQSILIEDYGDAIAAKDEKLREEYNMYCDNANNENEVILDEDEIYVENSALYSYVFIKTIHKQVK